MERLHALWGTVAGAAWRPWHRQEEQQTPRQPHVTIVTTRYHQTVVTQPHYTQKPRVTFSVPALWAPHRFHYHYPSAKATSPRPRVHFREPPRIRTLRHRTQFVVSHVDYTVAMIDINLSLQKLLDRFEQVKFYLTFSPED